MIDRIIVCILLISLGFCISCGEPVSSNQESYQLRTNAQLTVGNLYEQILELEGEICQRSSLYNCRVDINHKKFLVLKLGVYKRGCQYTTGHIMQRPPTLRVSLDSTQFMLGYSEIFPQDSFCLVIQKAMALSSAEDSDIFLYYPRPDVALNLNRAFEAIYDCVATDRIKSLNMPGLYFVVHDSLSFQLD